MPGSLLHAPHHPQATKCQTRAERYQQVQGDCAKQGASEHAGFQGLHERIRDLFWESSGSLLKISVQGHRSTAPQQSQAPGTRQKRTGRCRGTLRSRVPLGTRAFRGCMRRAISSCTAGGASSNSRLPSGQGNLREGSGSGAPCLLAWLLLLAWTCSSANALLRRCSPLEGALKPPSVVHCQRGQLEQQATLGPRQPARRLKFRTRVRVRIRCPTVSWPGPLHLRTPGSDAVALAFFPPFIMP